MLGAGAVDKVVDVAVAAIAMKAALSDLANLDFAYAPPFSTAIHPFAAAVQILQNKLSGALVSVTPAEYKAGKAEGYRVVDVGMQPSIPGADWLDLTAIGGVVPGYAVDEKLLLVCAKGKRAYLTQNRLRHYGYTDTLVLEGGVTVNGSELVK